MNEEICALKFKAGGNKSVIVNVNELRTISEPHHI